MLEVATRNRKRDGEWSKPKGRRFALSEIAHLPEPADRQAMAILAGGREQVSDYYSGHAATTTSAPARFRLAHALERGPAADDLRNGPVPAAGIGAGRCMRPLRWDDAGPWEFWLKVTPDEAGKTYAITGELRRGEERLALETPLLLLSGGLVFWEDRVAPLLDFDAFQWIALLRQQGEVPVPAKQKAGVPRGIAPAAGPAPARPAGGPAVRGGRAGAAALPEGQASRRPVRWMSDRDQNWLIGDLSFEYDGHVVPARSPARSVFEADKRRLLLRDPAAERTFEGRLEEVGFHRRAEYRQGEILELLARNLPKAARALLQEGWRVEAEGKLYRQAGDFRIEVDVRDRLVRPARRRDLRRSGGAAARPCSRP